MAMVTWDIRLAVQIIRLTRVLVQCLDLRVRETRVQDILDEGQQNM